MCVCMWVCADDDDDDGSAAAGDDDDDRAATKAKHNLHKGTNIEL